MKKSPDAPLPCPCGSGRPYAACCGRWHAGPGHLLAPTAEALMRSRYTAFVRDDRAYLLASWHPRTRPAEIEGPEPGLKWLGLDVRRAEQHDADHATVEFVARWRLPGGAGRMHETSRFERVDRHWYYVDGDLDAGARR